MSTPVCGVCRKGGDEIILCEVCKAPYHLTCLNGCLCCKKKPTGGLVKTPQVPEHFLCKHCDGHLPTLQPGEKVLTLLYAFGLNQAGQLGIGKVETKEPVPVLVEDVKSVEVVELVLGGWNSMLRTSDGDIYTCGDGENGKLGHSNVVHEHLSRFRIVEKLRAENRSQGEGPISRIAMGRDHACVITTEGHMYTWGNGDEGKLGHQDMGAKKLPTKISALLVLEQPVADIVALGHSFTTCIGIENILMTWGANNCGQLATGDARGKWVPQLVNPDRPDSVGLAYYTKNTESTYDIEETIRDLCAGKAHALAVTKTGKLYSWGSAVSGQTGMGEEKLDPDDLWARNYKNLVRPKVIPGLSSVCVNLVCAGADYCLALSNSNELYGWGANNFGQLGMDPGKPTVWVPTVINTEDILGQITQLSAGEGHSAVVTSCGEIYTWGDNREGQLGLGHFDHPVSKPTPVKLVLPADAAGQTPFVHCGGFHTFIRIRTINRNLNAKKPVPKETEKKEAPKKKGAPKKAAAKAEKPEKATKKPKKEPAKKPAKRKKKADASDSDRTESESDDAPLTKKGK